MKRPFLGPFFAKIGFAFRTAVRYANEAIGQIVWAELGLEGAGAMASL